jgi:hypothetical protein
MCGTKDGLVKFYSIEFQKGSGGAQSDPNVVSPKPAANDHKTLKEHFLKRQRKIQQHSQGSRLSSREISEDSQVRCILFYDNFSAF